MSVPRKVDLLIFLKEFSYADYSQVDLLNIKVLITEELMKLHDKEIAHKHLVPENIEIEESIHVKQKKFNIQLVEHKCFTMLDRLHLLMFKAPEYYCYKYDIRFIVDAISIQPKNTPKLIALDVYSLGVIFARFIEIDNRSEKEKTLVNKIKSCEIAWKESIQQNPNIKKLLQLYKNKYIRYFMHLQKHKNPTYSYRYRNYLTNLTPLKLSKLVKEPHLNKKLCKSLMQQIENLTKLYIEYWQLSFDPVINQTTLKDEIQNSRMIKLIVKMTDPDPLKRPKLNKEVIDILKGTVKNMDLSDHSSKSDTSELNLSGTSSDDNEPSRSSLIHSI